MKYRLDASGLGVERFSGLYLWLLFIIIFGVWVPNLFLSADTWHSLASAQSISAIIALAVLIPLAAGQFDLSVGANANLAAIVATVLQTVHHWSVWPAVGVAIAGSVLIGTVNGFLVVRLRINSFIATLGMTTILSAVQSIVSNNSQPLPPTSQLWNNLTQTTVAGFQSVVLYLLVAVMLSWWLLDWTPAGRYLYALGGNSEAARLSGVRVGLWTWLSLVISGAICGVCGILYASLYGPSLTFGGSLLLPAFAAVFLGSTQVSPGRFNVWGTMIAVFVLATGVKGLQLVTGVQWLNDMFNGVALIGAVGFAVWRQRASGSKRRSHRSDRPAASRPLNDADRPNRDDFAAVAPKT